jgi:enhancer of mRNA-decapping protein 4
VGFFLLIFLLIKEITRKINFSAVQILSIASSLPNPIQSETHRLIWCMFLPDNEQDIDESNMGDDSSKVFVVTHHTRADVYHLDLIRSNYGEINLESDQIIKGHMCFDKHDGTILTASFSPDGTAVATAGADGNVNFYKISFANGDSESTVALSKWIPHDSRAVTSLYFMDDHRNPLPDAQFWNFIITGSDFNREIKIWCCLKWQCLQTIRFTCDDDIAPCLKTSIDLSSNYLLLSDISKKVWNFLKTQSEFIST